MCNIWQLNSYVMFPRISSRISILPKPISISLVIGNFGSCEFVLHVRNGSTLYDILELMFQRHITVIIIILRSSRNTGCTFVVRCTFEV